MDAHSAEYAAAISGMNETYGPRRAAHTHAVGDFVSGITAGKRWSGHIEWYSDDDGMVVVNVNHAWVRVPVSDITH